MATTNLVQGLERMKEARVELEAAVAVKLAEAPSWLLVAVAEILANQASQRAVEVPLRGGSVAVLVGEPEAKLGKATLKVAEAGVTVTHPGFGGRKAEVVRTALASLHGGGTAADVLRQIRSPESLGVKDPLTWVRANLREGVNRGEFARSGRGVFEIALVAVKKPGDRLSPGEGLEWMKRALTQLGGKGSVGDILKALQKHAPKVFQSWNLDKVGKQLSKAFLKGEVARDGVGLYRVKQMASKKPVKAQPVTIDKVWGVLRKGSATPVEVASKLGCEGRHLGTILGRLAKRGWATRDDETGKWSVTKKGNREGG